ncbi:hypothetical protein PCE31106_00706 [Pandoraea cepalis]|uniref:Uncharacterized protein n=1 Tax=Pandoraea cepalis TaxID=2508294 RepID=A0A5E4SG19_9BURK|nr:hypothetical protein [Pandoraea cepalis]VVD73108.1 hypothetical protein PCE31106_00706 [Pandoraea cepalis]
MSLLGFLLKSKANTEAQHKSLVDEFIDLVAMTAANRNEAETYLQLARLSDAYGSDVLLLNGSTHFRDSAIQLSDQEARALQTKTSAEYLGLRFLNLWLRAQQENSDDGKELFLRMCGPIYKARITYYTNLTGTSRFRLQRVAAMGLEDTRRFQDLKNFMLLRELGEGCTTQHIVGCILGYTDFYLSRLGLNPNAAENYGPLIRDERLAKFETIQNAYTRNEDVKPESMKLIEVGRTAGAEQFLEVMALLER